MYCNTLYINLGVVNIETLVIIILLAAGAYVGWNIGANDAANCIGTSVGAGIISYRKAIVLMAIFVTIGAALQGQYVMKTIGKGIVLSSEESFIDSQMPSKVEKEIFEKNFLSKISGESELKIANGVYVLNSEKEIYELKKPDKNASKEEKENYVNNKIRIYGLLVSMNFPGVKAVPKDFKKHFADDRLSDRAIFAALMAAGIFVTIATFASLPVSTSQSIVGGVAGVGLGIVGMNPDYFNLDVIIKIIICWISNPILSICLSLPWLLLTALPWSQDQ